jgi:acyl transferase domain-containing protein
MGLELYRDELFFRELIDRCAEILKPLLGLNLRDVLYPTEVNEAAATEKLRQTGITQPALFVVEYCLARLWMHWGIQPETMIGHSIGEYVAACLAGVFTLEEALPLIVIRGRLVAEMPEGGMLAVRLSEDELTPLLNERLALAAVNSTSQCVVAGDSAAIANLDRLLQEQSVVCSRLNTSHAMHSATMDPILELFKQHLQQMTLKPPSIRYLSNVTGTWITDDEAVSPVYWARHLRETVRFARGVEQLLQEPDAVLLEVGPGKMLGRFAQQLDHARSHQTFATLPPVHGELSTREFVLQTLGSLWMMGIPIEWSRLHRHVRRYRVALPSYPFERRRYWVTPSVQRESGKQPRAVQDEIPQPMNSEKLRENKPEATMPEQPDPGSARSRRRDAILNMLHATVNKLIGIETSEKDIHVNFFDLGVDSLLIIQFTQAIEEQCGQRIPFRLLFEELTTLDAVSQYLDEQLRPEMFAGEPEVEVIVATPDVSVTPVENPQPAQITPAKPVATIDESRPRIAEPVKHAAVTNPAIRDLYAEQLRLMSQQLEIMRQMNHNGTAPSLGSVAPAQTGREEQPATVKSISPRTDAESFLPHKPLELKAAADLSPHQSEYLNSFTRSYVKRTARSKQNAQDSRGPLADYRH